MVRLRVHTGMLCVWHSQMHIEGYQQSDFLYQFRFNFCKYRRFKGCVLNRNKDRYCWVQWAVSVLFPYSKMFVFGNSSTLYVCKTANTLSHLEWLHKVTNRTGDYGCELNAFFFISWVASVFLVIKKISKCWRVYVAISTWPTISTAQHATALSSVSSFV